MKIVHYINQFFAGIGGEERADEALSVREGPVGPGMLLARLAPDAGITTVVCGDTYAAEHLDEVVGEVVRIAEERRPDVVVCGPAFNAGRYGLACGELSKQIPARTGIPAITGLYEENAAVSLYAARALIVRTGRSAMSMQRAMEAIVGLLPRVVAGEAIEDREAAGLFSSNVRRNRINQRSGADRAIDMVLALVAGDEVGTELNLPDFERPTPPPPVPALASATVALVTEGGLVPHGNPDGLSTGWSRKWASYPVQELLGEPGRFGSIHGGYDTRFVNESPFRLVPADVVAELVAEGRIGALHPRYFVTAGMATPVENARAMGSEIAEVLQRDGVDAVVLTST